MRKLMNKKGFSLVELMIVVVIMGILIAVAIPLYGAITDNANNNTCKNNIKAIQSNAANYKATYDKNVDGTTLTATFADGMPKCPVDPANAYKVWINTATGAVVVKCQNAKTDEEASADGATNKFHTHKKVGSVETDPTTGYTALSFS